MLEGRKFWSEKKKKKKKKLRENRTETLFKTEKRRLDIVNYLDVVSFIPLLTLNSCNTSKGAARLQSPQEK